MGSSSVNLIIPVQGAEGPAVGKVKRRNQLKSVIVSFVAAYQQNSDASLTTEAGSVRGIHGHHCLRDTRWTADTCLVQGRHPEDVRTALHQTCDGKAGVLDWSVIALGPVVGSHLTPVNETHINRICECHTQHYNLVIRNKSFHYATAIS